MDVNPSPSTSLRCFILRRDFLLDHGRIFEHFQLEIAARSKDKFLPIGFQGIGAS